MGYVTHGVFANGVTVINTATNSVVTNIPVEADVTIAPAVTPNGAFVYVTCLDFPSGSHFGNSKVAVIDTATNTVVAIVPLRVESFSLGVAITPDGAFAYVANNFSSNSLSVIDTATNTEVASLPVGLFPTGIAVTPDGAFVYVTNAGDNTVSVVRTTPTANSLIEDIQSFATGF